MIRFPLYVTIDTNIFDAAKYNFSENGQLKRLVRYVDNGKLRVVLSDVVIGELHQHVRNNAELLGNRYNKSIKEMKAVCSDAFIQSLGFQSTLIKANKSILMDKAEKELDKYLSELKHETLDCNSITIKSIVNDYFGGKPPFENKKDKKNEFPDAIISAEIRVRFENREELAIVSEDEGFKIACGSCNNFLFFESLRELFNYIVREEESYNNAVGIINSRIEEICRIITNDLKSNEHIEINGLSYDTNGIEYGFDYDDFTIHNIEDIGFRLHTVEEIKDNRIYATLVCHACIEAICYYEDYDNALWDPENKEYVYVETKAVLEQHSVSFPVDIIVSDKGKVESVLFYVILGGDSFVSRDVLE